MKNINKFIICLVLFAMAFVSCDRDEDKNPFPEPNQEDNIAPYMRVKDFQTVVPVPDLATGSFEANFNTPRDNVSSYDLAVSHEPAGGTATDAVTVMSLTTFPSDVEIPYTELAAAVGVSIDDIGGGDIFRFLGTVTSSTTGEAFTIENYSASITGQPEQLQAFNFFVLVKCAQISDATVGGTWTLDLTDLYGDGWDGAFITFEINGVTTDYTIAGGSAASFDIDVPDGAELVISYTSGAFEEEHVFSITSPDGPYGDYGPNPGPCVN